MFETAQHLETSWDIQQTLRLRSHRARYCRDAWNAMLSSWSRPANSCSLWLMHAASYLFNSDGVRWAVDPLVPGNLLADFPNDLPIDPLKRLSFVLLTHDHADHVDYDLLSSLRESEVRYVVPEHMVERFVERVEPCDSQIALARPGDRLEFDDIAVIPFSGLHWKLEQGKPRGTDATGYVVRVAGRRWLFPGDVRSYRPEIIARFAPVDLLFAHLWLGRAAALDPVPPELDKFCDFMTFIEPQRVMLTHLYEFSRPSRDLWTRRHAEMVRLHWRACGQDAPICLARPWEELRLH